MYYAFCATALETDGMNQICATTITYRVLKQEHVIRLLVSEKVKAAKALRELDQTADIARHFSDLVSKLEPSPVPDGPCADGLGTPSAESLRTTLLRAGPRSGQHGEALS
ncbi:hypothetical protein TREES_T100015896 [Tupaia chinensis]|uniref:Uncharacterized protein n=1 Tax=Tupaia chinensis TaxID=246437 RepID=L9L1H3_TUPCH|nr:hypothetical protein TREES_T100015896 [Tupaia chinensis]